MEKRPTTVDARQSLTGHLAAKGTEVFLKYGPRLGWPELLRLLKDRTLVRYPWEIVFDATLLQPGEFAHPEPKGPRPEDGFTMYVHPVFAADVSQVPPLVLYQLVAVNYGDFASAEEAENFGAAALGLTRGEYYSLVCSLADRVEDTPEQCKAAAVGR